MEVRQHKIPQCSSLTDAVSPPDAFANGVEMLFCHVCQHLPVGAETFFLFLKAEMRVSVLAVL